MSGFAVVICGGGIAGIEGLLRLRRLAGDAIQVTLLSSEQDLVYRPLAVLEPFAMVRAARYPIRRIVADAGARRMCDRVAWVDRDAGIVHTAGGSQLRYDALLLAVGGRERTPPAHVSVFTDHTSEPLYQGIVDQLDAGVLTSLALVEPAGPSWPLPLYELALLTAKRARDAGAHPQIAVITPDPRPLDSFGGEVSAAVTGLLRAAGITLYTGSRIRVSGPGQLVVEPSGIELRADQIVTLPTITGPNVRGIPGGGNDRFLPVDDRCRVRDTDGRIFAAGDATDLPIKQGGLGAQQADTAAAGIAHLAGTAPAPAPMQPVMRGMLLTGDKPLYLTAYLIAGSGWRAEIHAEAPWQLDEAIVAEELGPYLTTLPPLGTPAPPTRIETEEQPNWRRSCPGFPATRRHGRLAPHQPGCAEPGASPYRAAPGAGAGAGARTLAHRSLSTPAASAARSATAQTSPTGPTHDTDAGRHGEDQDLRRECRSSAAADRRAAHNDRLLSDPPDRPNPGAVTAVLR